MNITIVSGSSRNPNLSHRVALHLQQKLTELYPAHHYCILDVRNHRLDFVNDVWMKKEDLPKEHEALGELVFDADAFILVTPEYNGSYSAVMKNLLDHFPKYAKRVFGIVTYSTGAMGGMRAAHQMQQMICAFMGVPSPQMLLIGSVDKRIDETGNSEDAVMHRMSNTFLNEFVWLAEAVYDKRNCEL